MKAESSIEVAVAAEKAARITAGTAAEAVRVRNETTIEAAAALAAAKEAQNAQDVQKANTFGVAATLGTGITLVTYGVTSPILVPALPVLVGIVTSIYRLLC